MTASASTASARRAREIGSRASWAGLLYVAPALLVIATFTLYPLANTAWISLWSWTGLNQATWAGLANYQEIFSDSTLLAAFGHAFVLVVFYAVLPIVVALLLASVMQRASRLRGIGVFRTLLFLPQVISTVVIGITWTAIYAPKGVLNRLLETVGLGSAARPWLGDFDFALPAVGLIGTWIEIGLCLVLFLSGIGQIPTELFEAARTDGAGPVREFFAITLPALRGQVAIALTLTVIAALRTFDLVYVTTRGGPGTQTTVPAYQIYSLAFAQNKIGTACALGVLLTVLLLVITLAIQTLDRGEHG